MDGVRAAAIFKQTAADGVAKPRRYGRGGRSVLQVRGGSIRMCGRSVVMIAFFFRSFVEAKQTLLRDAAAVDASRLSERERLLLSHHANKFSLLFQSLGAIDIVLISVRLGASRCVSAVRSHSCASACSALRRSFGSVSNKPATSDFAGLLMKSHTPGSRW